MIRESCEGTVREVFATRIRIDCRHFPADSVRVTSRTIVRTPAFQGRVGYRNYVEIFGIGDQVLFSVDEGCLSTKKIWFVRELEILEKAADVPGAFWDSGTVTQGERHHCIIHTDTMRTAVHCPWFAFYPGFKGKQAVLQVYPRGTRLYVRAFLDCRGRYVVQCARLLSDVAAEVTDITSVHALPPVQTTKSILTNKIVRIPEPQNQSSDQACLPISKTPTMHGCGTLYSLASEHGNDFFIAVDTEGRVSVADNILREWHSGLTPEQLSTQRRQERIFVWFEAQEDGGEFRATRLSAVPLPNISASSSTHTVSSHTSDEPTCSTSSDSQNSGSSSGQEGGASHAAPQGMRDGVTQANEIGADVLDEAIYAMQRFATFGITAEKEYDKLKTECPGLFRLCFKDNA